MAHPDDIYHELRRMKLDEVIAQAHRAVREHDWEQAVPLWREAVARAPFRQDYRESLSRAVESSIENAADRSRLQHARSSVNRAVEKATVPAEEGIRLVPVAPPSRSAPAESRPSPFRPAGGAPRERAAQGKKPPPAPPAIPGSFSKRHKRGPLSAILSTFFSGAILVVLVAGGVWLYLEYKRKGPPESAVPGNSSAAVQEELNLAAGYKQKGQYSRAIEILQTLPSFPRRDQQLAAIYMDQGDTFLMQQPRNLKGAIEAYKQAVGYFPEKTDHALVLGNAFYLLALENNERPEIFNDNLKLARQTFEAVLERDPENIRALDALADVAIQQRDQVLQVKCLRLIAEISPDSDKGRDARRDLQSLGVRY